MTFTASLDDAVTRNESGLLSSHETWCRCPLSDVATVLNGFAFPSANFSRTAGVPLLRIRDVLSDRTDALYDGEYDSSYVVGPGDLVIGMDGDFNCALWRGPEAVLNQRVCKATPDERFYDRRFLSHVLPGYLRAINAETSSLTVKHLSSRTVEQIPLPLPPLPEQHRIVAEIEKHFTRLEASAAELERAQTNLKRYRATVLRAACEGRLVPTEAELARAEGREYEPADVLLDRILQERRAKRGEPPAPDASGLPELSEGWVWASLGQVFRVFVGATPSRARSEYWNGDIPWVSSGEVSFCTIRDTRECISDLGLRNSSTELHPPGTVLLGMIGEGKTRGQAAILAIAACNNQNSAAIRVSEAGLPPGYIFRFLEGQYEQTRQIGSGNNQPALNKSRVQNIVFPLPPLAEQHRIVSEVERRLSLVDELEAVVGHSLKRAERLRQSILKRAFEGRLVPQDPNDEPASVLLERIRGERAAQAHPRNDRRGRRASSKRRMRKASALLPQYRTGVAE